MPGGALSISPDIPMQIGENDFNLGHRIMAEAMLRVDTAFSENSEALTLDEFKRLLFRTVSDHIDCKPTTPGRDDLQFETHIIATTDSVAAMTTCHSQTLLTPGWFEIASFTDEDKGAAAKAIIEVGGMVMPIGTMFDLEDEAASIYWEGETTDEGAIETLRAMQEDGHEPDFSFLPSALRDQPRWVAISKEKNPTATSTTVKRLIRDLVNAGRNFSTLSEKTTYWKDFFDSAMEMDPTVADSSHTPCLFLIPLNDTTTRVIDDITQYAMQTRFADICGAAFMDNADEMVCWLSAMKAATAIVEAVEALINLDKG